MNITEFRKRFRQIHRVDGTEAVLVDHENVAIREALTHHSLQLPCRGSYAATVSSGSLALSAITGWGPGWQVERVMKGGRALPRDLWAADGTNLCLSASGPVRVDYIRPHVLDGCETTLRDDEFEPVARLATHFLLAQLSNDYMKKRQSSLGPADAVNFEGQNVGYFTKSQDELRRYQTYVNSRYRPGSARVDYDLRSQTGRRPLFGDGRFS